MHERLPDKSYDLNNDGIISDREYVIARRFDGNLDGKLEPDERKKATEALHSGFENNFVWGLEKYGALRGTRILQLRGKIIDSEDFLSIKDTYPPYQKSQNASSIGTYTELASKRHNDLVESLKNKKEVWDKSHPNKVSYKYPYSEYLIKFPKFLFIYN